MSRFIDVNEAAGRIALQCEQLTYLDHTGQFSQLRVTATNEAICVVYRDGATYKVKRDNVTDYIDSVTAN